MPLSRCESMRARVLIPLVAVPLLLAAAVWAGRRVVPGPRGDGSTLLANGWTITPAGRSVRVGTLPLGLTVLPDGRVLALLSGYSTNGLVVVDPARWEVTDSVPLSAAWLGLAAASDGAVYASGGTTNRVWRLREVAGRWQRADSVVLADSGAALFAAGLTLSADGRSLAVVAQLGDSVFLLDAATLRRTAAAATGSHPYTARFTPDGRTLLVSNWGDSTLSRFEVGAGALEPRGTIAVPPRPSALMVSPDGRTLYVAHAAADAVSLVDLGAGRVTSTVRLSLTRRAPHGTGPNALALSPDGRTLYVANADNNDVAVVALGEEGGPRVAGLIPTAWYPTAVAVSTDGRTLYVANGKGTGTGPNPHGPTAPDTRRDQYIGALLVGSLSAIPVPGAAALGRDTRQVLANSPYRDALLTRQPWPRRSPIPRSASERSPIRHVVYVIRENRTYDQVLGDDARGNGDPGLAIFGDSITPNAHALASQFVLFDNFYVNGDVSANGHMWSDAAYASDYNEKNWPANYSRRREYDFDAGLPANDPLAGFLWDAARAAGRSMRNYGEMTQWDPASGRATPQPKGLEGVTDPRYPGFVLEIPDSVRADEFIRELREAETGGTLPELMILWLPRDHTYGRQPGRPTPRAMVAENDRALGRIVEALSRSRFWRETAMFVLEDDAQNGPDHVDAHRSPLLVASPWVRRGMVDSTFYTTASVLRTIELILGLRPMSQFDAAAMPLFTAFMTRPDSAAYTALPARWPLEELNPPGRSALDPRAFTRPDFADDQVLNREIWASVRRTPMPAPRHSAMAMQGAR
jgi:DNA-binding beta-propeller fold protein YncE